MWKSGPVTYGTSGSTEKSLIQGRKNNTANFSKTLSGAEKQPVPKQINSVDWVNVFFIHFIVFDLTVNSRLFFFKQSYYHCSKFRFQHGEVFYLSSQSQSILCSWIRVSLRSEEGATICQEVVFHVALERLCLIWSGSWSQSTEWLKGSPLSLLQVLGQELCLSQQRIKIVLSHFCFIVFVPSFNVK